MTMLAIAVGAIVALLALKLIRSAVKFAAVAALIGFGLFMAHQGGAF